MKLKTTAAALRERMIRRYEPGELEVVSVDGMLYCVYEFKREVPLYFGTIEHCRSWIAYHTKRAN